MIEEGRKPDKEYTYKGYNVKVYYGDKTKEEVIAKLIENKTNKYIKEILSMKSCQK